MMPAVVWFFIFCQPLVVTFITGGGFFMVGNSPARNRGNHLYIDDNKKFICIAAADWF